MTVSENVYSAIESTLTKTPVIYRNTEIMPKTFLVSTGSKSWNHEDIFNCEPIRRFSLAMTTNKAFLGSKADKPFHYQKFNLENITVYRNAYPIAATPLQTDNDKNFYLNSLEALAFESHGHGVPFRLSKPLRFSIRPYKYPSGFSRLFISSVNQRLHIN